MAVAIWLLPDVDALPTWVDAHILSFDEQARAERISHIPTRNQFVRCRLLLRTLLASRLDCSPSAIAFTIAPDGKPHLANRADRHFFNVSHTEGLIAIAIGPRPLGIDVEVHRDHRDRAGLVDRYFAIEERQQYHALPEALKPAAFLRGWTCKEALLKGTGAGVRDLQNCAIDLDPRLPPRVLRHTDSQPWRLAILPTPNGIAGALALATNEEIEFSPPPTSSAAKT